MDEIDAFLVSEGFSRSFSRIEKTPCYRGSLNIEKKQIQLEFKFIHKELDYPEVYISDWPFDSSLRESITRANINSNGKICHTDDSRSWWDASQSARFTSGVLSQVKSLLSRNIRGEYDPSLMVQDFNGYWDATNTLYLADSINNKDILLAYSRKGLSWLSQELSPSSWLAKTPSERKNTPWLVVQTNEPPVPTGGPHWPPKTLSHLSEWLSQKNNSTIPKLIQSIIDTTYCKKAQKKRGFTPERIGIVLKWPNTKNTESQGTAISFKVTGALRTSLEQGRIKGASTLFSKSNELIQRYNLERADPSYLHNRNVPTEQKTLKNKHVLLVGTGAIGGYLAQSLCCLGAGLGPKGKLTMVDHDLLKPGNIGRHLLGIDSLGHFKVNALQERFGMDFPHLSINAVADKIFNVSDLLTKADIVINATGSQTVSISIEKLINSLAAEKRPVIIHSWIQGQGLATAALLRENRKDACFRCLWQLENDIYKPRFSLSKNSDLDEPIFGGCHQSYHPYVVTAATTAANQVTTMLINWLNGKVTKKLQFNILQPDYCENRPDCSPKPSPECPICSANNEVQ
jgi:molybdopterin/thiamine biosynthesis adenylyltransferase